MWLSKDVNATQHHENIWTGRFCLPMRLGCQNPHLRYRSGLCEGCSSLEPGEDASMGYPWFVIEWRQSGELKNTVESKEIVEMRLKYEC
jgi:hypothetical protein